MGYGLGVLRIEKGRENGFNAEEYAKKKKRFIGSGSFWVLCVNRAFKRCNDWDFGWILP